MKGIKLVVMVVVVMVLVGSVGDAWGGVTEYQHSKAVVEQLGSPPQSLPPYGESRLVYQDEVVKITLIIRDVALPPYYDETVVVRDAQTTDIVGRWFNGEQTHFTEGLWWAHIADLYGNLTK